MHKLKGTTKEYPKYKSVVQSLKISSVLQDQLQKKKLPINSS